MGATKQVVEKPIIREKRPVPPPLIGLAIFVIVVLLFLKIGLEAAYTAPKLHPKEEGKLIKRLKEIDDSEQYVLVATVDGWYSCLHNGRTRYYLKTGEVWKYGVTSKGQFGRYSAAFLVKNRVSYLIQFKGTYSECLKQEQIKLYYYPFLPENLARAPAERLPRPPYNSVMR
ncbi:MAG: hypothetical protein KDD14_07385 [Saprospiraceae bacterium]|nr:hypothetical protein [Saprospiraceae bacterium]